MTTEQTLIGGFFQATGRKRQSHGSLPESKKSKEFNISPTKAIINKGIMCLQKQQVQKEANKPIARKAKQAPARKPRGSKKLMQVSAPPPTTRSTRRNAMPAPNETFSQLDNALTNSKSPLKPSTPLNSGMKALSATRDTTQHQIPKVTMVTSPIASYTSPTVLKIPTVGASNIEQVTKVRRKLMADLQQNSKYTVPPLPTDSEANKRQSLARKLAEPTKVEIKQTGNSETLKPIEFPSVASCLSPSKKDNIIRRLALMKTPEKSPKIKEFTELQFSSPTKIKHTNTTPMKSPQYQTNSHLAANTRMPISYAQTVLLEHFRCIDVALSMVERRKESCTFEKLQRAVITMSGKQMTLRNLSQILFLYPTAFSLSYQPIRTSINSPRRGQYQLIVAANNDLHSESPTRTNASKSIRSLTNQELLIRKNQFHAYIIKYLTGYHAEFLQSMVPSVDIPSDKIKRWHPEFDPNTVPAIPEGNVPQKPQSNTPQTAKQILASSQDLLPTRISRVMLKFTEENSNQESELESETKEVCNEKSNELKGVSKNLIERIRIKEQEKVKLSMVRDDKLLHKLDMLERLPEMCSIVRNMYLAEKRGTLPWGDVVYKLRDSHHSKMDQKYLEEHLSLLLEILPQWASVVTLKNTKYLKVIRNTPLNKLLSELGREKARLEIQ